MVWYERRNSTTPVKQMSVGIASRPDIYAKWNLQQPGRKQAENDLFTTIGGDNDVIKIKMREPDDSGSRIYFTPISNLEP